MQIHELCVNLLFIIIFPLFLCQPLSALSLWKCISIETYTLKKKNQPLITSELPLVIMHWSLWAEPVSLSIWLPPLKLNLSLSSSFPRNKIFYIIWESLNPKYCVLFAKLMIWTGEFFTLVFKLVSFFPSNLYVFAHGSCVASDWSLLCSFLSLPGPVLHIPQTACWCKLPEQESPTQWIIDNNSTALASDLPGFTCLLNGFSQVG